MRNYMIHIYLGENSRMAESRSFSNMCVMECWKTWMRTQQQQKIVFNILVVLWKNPNISLLNFKIPMLEYPFFLSTSESIQFSLFIVCHLNDIIFTSRHQAKSFQIDIRKLFQKDKRNEGGSWSKRYIFDSRETDKKVCSR